MKWYVSLGAIALSIAPVAHVSGQTPQPVAGRVWYDGMRGDLPVRVHFFSSAPSNVLDSAAVHDAARTALMFAGFQPDVRVSIFPLPSDTVGVHVQMEVNVYTSGEIRYDAKFRDRSGKTLDGCGDGSQFGSTSRVMAVLLLSHQMRSTLSCARVSKNIAQLLPKD